MSLRNLLVIYKNTDSCLITVRMLLQHAPSWSEVHFHTFKICKKRNSTYDWLLSCFSPFAQSNRSFILSFQNIWLAFCPCTLPLNAYVALLAQCQWRVFNFSGIRFPTTSSGLVQHSHRIKEETVKRGRWKKRLKLVQDKTLQVLESR